MYRTVKMSGKLYSIEIDEDAYEDEMDDIATLVNEGITVTLTEELPEDAILVERD